MAFTVSVFILLNEVSLGINVFATNDIDYVLYNNVLVNDFTAAKLRPHINLPDCMCLHWDSADLLLYVQLFATFIGRINCDKMIVLLYVGLVTLLNCCVD